MAYGTYSAIVINVGKTLRGALEMGKILLSALAACAAALAQSAESTTNGVSSHGLPPPTAKSAPDFVNARAKPLPLASGYDRKQVAKDLQAAASEKEEVVAFQTPAISKGARGSGTRWPVKLGKPKLSSVTPFALGTSLRPFTTARADLERTPGAPWPTNETYPYRASGKVFFKQGNDSFICSGSLIGPGIVATAAHCVSDFGTKTYYSDFHFIPGYRDGDGPFGDWAAEKVYVLDRYLDGTDSCAQSGVVCESDVAIMVLRQQKDGNGKLFYPGQNTGWYAYPRTDKFGFTAAGLTHVTQIGYPYCLDSGARMQRTDSHAVISKDYSDNTVIGSLMCGGSSGGGWFVNFGVGPELNGTTPGMMSEPNVLVGVTSWGSSSNAVKNQGASPIRVNNFVKLVDAACAQYPSACK